MMVYTPFFNFPPKPFLLFLLPSLLFSLPAALQQGNRIPADQVPKYKERKQFLDQIVTKDAEEIKRTCLVRKWSSPGLDCLLHSVPQNVMGGGGGGLCNPHTLYIKGVWPQLIHSLSSFIMHACYGSAIPLLACLRNSSRGCLLSFVSPSSCTVMLLWCFESCFT